MRNGGQTLEVALGLAGRGWPVFPLEPTGKKPLRGSRGFHDATTDAARIQQWEWGGANIAIRTGRPANLLVLDVDPRHDGDDALYELERQHGRLPQSVAVKTGGGGRHVYFRCSEPVRTRQNVLASGIDVKADGGYVAAPPSVHPSGRPYEWDLDLDDVDLEPVPDWLLQAVVKGSRTKPRRRLHAGPILKANGT
jgi:hypothetical protein